MKLHPGTILCILLLTTAVACSKHDNPAPVTTNPTTPSPGDTSAFPWQRITVRSGMTGIYDLCFTDARHGFLLGSDSTICSSSDSGFTWQPYTGFKGFFLKLYFLNAQQGYAAGFADFATTADGGQTWTKKSLGTATATQTPSNPYKWASLQFVSPSTGYLTNGSGLYKTTDTGTTWNPVYAVASNGLFFSDSLTGWFYSSPDSISLITGGVINAHVAKVPIQATFQNEVYNKIQFTDPQHGWFMDFSVFAATTNGGNTWTANTTMATLVNGGYLTDFFMLSPQSGYVATTQRILTTSDGGQTWKQDFSFISTTDTAINSLYFLDQHNGWAGCSNGAILRRHQ